MPVYKHILKNMHAYIDIHTSIHTQTHCLHRWTDIRIHLLTHTRILYTETDMHISVHVHTLISVSKLSKAENPYTDTKTTRRTTNRAKRISCAITLLIRNVIDGVISGKSFIFQTPSPICDMFTACLGQTDDFRGNVHSARKKTSCVARVKYYRAQYYVISLESSIHTCDVGGECMDFKLKSTTRRDPTPCAVQDHTVLMFHFCIRRANAAFQNRLYSFFAHYVHVTLTDILFLRNTHVSIVKHAKIYLKNTLC